MQRTPVFPGRTFGGSMLRGKILRAFTGSLLAGAIVLAGASWGAAPALARGWHEGGWHGGPDGDPLGFLLRKADPTTDQKHAIAAVLTQHKAQLTAAADTLSQTRLAVMRLQLADHPDAQALGAGYDQLSAAAKAMGLLRLQVRQEIMGVLTADQRATLGQSRDKMLQFMQDHRQDREGAVDRWIEKLSR